MKFKIADYPASYLGVEFEKDEKLIAEKGTFIICNGEYSYKCHLTFNRFEF